MTKNEKLLEIAKKNQLLRPQHVRERYHDDNGQYVPYDLTTTNSGADFYEVSVTGIRNALEEAYKAGKKAGRKKGKSGDIGTLG